MEMILNHNSLSAIYSIFEPLLIEECGPSDYAGRARCKLSNGTFKIIADPCNGMQVGVIVHKPEILILPDRNVIQITQWQKEPFEMKMEDVHKLAK